VFGFLDSLDAYIIDDDTVGTTFEELSNRLTLAYRENDLAFCFDIIFRSAVLILVGFFTFGALWPKFFRQILFTPPSPKESGDSPELERILDEVSGRRGESRVADPDTARLRRDVDELKLLIRELLEKEKVS